MLQSENRGPVFARLTLTTSAYAYRGPPVHVRPRSFGWHSDKNAGKMSRWQVLLLVKREGATQRAEE